MTVLYEPGRPGPQIERDHLGRPYVMPLGGDKPTPYTRCTTYVGSVEDTYNIELWKQRHLARGLAFNEVLLQQVRDANPETEAKLLNELCAQARDQSGAGDAMRMGTYLHTVTEFADRDLDPVAVELPWLATKALQPLDFMPDLAAYLEATSDLTAVSIEQFSVLDNLKVAGTPDRVVKYRGKRYIADLKTGSIELGSLKIAAQLAVYSRATPYDQPSHTRLEPHGADLQQGIVIHLPAGSATCHLYWVDLEAGWEAVRVARQVREVRKLRYKHLMKPLVAVPPPPRLVLADFIECAKTPDEVRALWRTYSSEWTDDLTELARAHIASLQGQPPSTTFERSTA